MYTAYARSIRRSADGQLHVRVDVLDDRGETVDAGDYSGSSLDKIKTAVQAELERLASRVVDDRGLSAAVVGTILGSI